MSPEPADLPPSSAPALSRADEATGLPGIRRWRTVYAIVLGVVVLWVGLLTWLTAHFA